MMLLKGAKMFYTRNNVSKALPIAIKVEQALIHSLYDAGMNMFKIADVLDITFKEVQTAWPEGKAPNPYPTNEANYKLIEAILYEHNYPVSVDVVVNNEKERYAVYSRLEKRCLDTMEKMLAYYASLPIGIDEKQDRFVASLAKDFIRVTHQARQELIQKYAIDKTSEQDKGVRITFVDSAIPSEKE